MIGSASFSKVVPSPKRSLLIRKIGQVSFLMAEKECMVGKNESLKCHRTLLYPFYITKKGGKLMLNYPLGLHRNINGIFNRLSKSWCWMLTKGYFVSSLKGEVKSTLITFADDTKLDSCKQLERQQEKMNCSIEISLMCRY